MAIITISRGTMSGGRQLAEMLADRPGYNCISREIEKAAGRVAGVKAVENRIEIDYRGYGID